jgi:hypothetical protein
MRLLQRALRRSGPRGAESAGPQFFSDKEWARFQQVLREALWARAIRAELLGPTLLRLPDLGRDFDVAGLAELCTLAPPAHWPRLINEELDLLLDVGSQYLDRDIVPQLLRVVLEPDTAEAGRAAHEPLAEGLRAVLCLDLATIVRPLSADNLAGFGLGVGQAWERAWVNTRADRSRPAVQRVSRGSTELLVVTGGPYLTARALWVDALVPPVGPEGALVALPDAGTVVVHPMLDHRAARAPGAIAAFAESRHASAPTPLSPLTYWWRQGKLTRLAAPSGSRGYAPPPEFLAAVQRLSGPKLPRQPSLAARRPPTLG